MNNTKPKLWSFPFFQVIIITFFFFLCLHMLNASFPVFVIEIGHHPGVGGMMTTAFMVAAIFTRPIINIFIHKIDMKKTIIITLLFILLSIFISYNSTSIPFLLFIRVLEGIGFGIITTLLATMATSIVPRERLGEGVGYFGMATSLGASISPLVALTIFHSYSFNAVLLFTLLTVLGILICSLFIQKIDSKKQSKAAEQADKTTSVIQYIFDKRALLPSILVFLLCITFSGVFSFMDGLGREAGLGGNVSLFFLIFTIVMLVIRPISGRIFDKFGHKVLIYPAGICGVIGLLLLGITNHLWLLFISAVFYGLAYGTIHPTLQSWAVSQVERNKNATANAMILTGMDLGMAVGTPILGIVAGQFGYQVMYGYTSVIIILLLMIYMAKMLQRNRQIKSAKKEKDSAVNL